ncbi:pentapeptide repeat-containing protein [Paracoccaceae bacterium GXU_MW_L88]
MLSTLPENISIEIGAALTLGVMMTLFCIILPLLILYPRKQLAELKGILGAENMHPWLFYGVAIIWAGVALFLLCGLMLTIGRVVFSAFPITDENLVKARFGLLSVAAITATLAAVIALPFSLLRARDMHRQTTAQEEDLLTTRINEAVTALGSQKEYSYVRRAKVYTETRPNLEVRIGAILALERLAQKNLDVHIQIMEILCAYVRENAPASEARALNAFEARNDTSNHQSRSKNYRNMLRDWIGTLPPTRADIHGALKVIGRRTQEQQTIEANFHRENLDIDWPFAEEFPEPGDIRSSQQEDNYSEKIKPYLDRFGAYTGYRIDLRETNLQAAQLEKFDLRGCDFRGACMQGALLRNTQLQGALLQNAQLQGAVARQASLKGAALQQTCLQGTILWEAQMQGADLQGAQMQLADTWNTQMQGAKLKGRIT